MRFQYIWIFIFGAYAFLGNTASLFGTNIDNMILWVEKVLSTNDIIIVKAKILFKFLIENYSTVSLFVLVISIIIALLTQYGVLSKSACYRINPLRFLKLIYPKTLYNLIFEVHEFQHKYETALRRLNTCKTNKNFLKDTFDSSIEDLLVQCNSILSKTTTSDISVNIKLFQNLKKTNSGKYEDSILVTTKRVPSKAELLRHRQKGIRFRASAEKFKLVDILCSDDLQSYSKIHKTYAYNLAYNYAFFSKDKRYWICNNLLNAQKKQKFYSSSNEYFKYYNSLAVFLLSPKQSSEDIDDNVIGLLIFDSLKSGVFEHIITGRIGGYLAHRLYEVVKLYKEIKDIEGS